MHVGVESHQKIGELLVRDGFLPPEAVQAALALQKTRPLYTPLGELLVEQKLLSRADLQLILQRYRKRLSLGEILLNLGLVSHEVLHEAIEFQKVEKKKLGKILVENGYLTESALITTLSQQLGIPRMIPSPGLVDPAILKGVSKAFLLKNECLPAFRDGDMVTVIMADPLSEETVRQLEGVLRCKVNPAIAAPEEIRVGITRVFDDLRMIEGAAERGQRAAESGLELVLDSQGPLEKADESVSQFLNFLMSRAIVERATDIHIEPMENLVRVRLRVDGLLQHTTDLPSALGAKVTSRIKAVSRMDITESRKHQDGRLTVQGANRRYDLRVASYSSFHGESLAIRILPNQSQMMDLDMLGMSPGQLATFRQILAIPSGITMVSGPSGSGKSTTVYAALRHQNAMDRKIVTVEDPIEYKIDGVMQSQVNEKAGLNYKSFIKSILRQDPDVVMIGEIRDRVSAESVIEVALSGHKVVTTFHTEDSVAALLRMFGIGVESFLITSTLMAVVGQRLVRTLCPVCKVRHTPSQEVMAAFDSIAPFDPAPFEFHVPAGCPRCAHTGFKGRSAICEILVINDPLRDAILEKQPYTKIRAVARATTGMVSIKEDGFYKATRGITSLEEVLRISPYHESDVLNARPPEEIVSLCEQGMGGN